MELQQLRYVVAVAETRSFTRAAERCFVVQSALSHQIKALERELGVRLFARSSRRVELTAAGQAFLTAARAGLDAVDRAAADARAADGRITGTLAVGLIPTVTGLDVPAALAAFRTENPGVRVALRGGSSDEFVRAIVEGGLDVAVLGLPESMPPQGVQTRQIARERLVAVLSPAHRLAGRRRLRLRDLADEAFVDFPSTSSGRAQSDLAFRAAGLRRDVAFEAMSPQLMLDLVGHDLAVALLAPGVVPADAPVRCVPVTDGPTRIEYLAWSSFNPSPAARAFVAAL